MTLRQRPVSSITSVTVGYPNNPQVLSATQYRVDTRTGELRAASDDGWFVTSSSIAPMGYGFQSIQVVYVAGEAAPASVVGVAMRAINRACAGLAVDPSVKSKTLGDASYTLNAAPEAATLTKEDMKILSLHRRWALS